MDIPYIDPAEFGFIEPQPSWLGEQPDPACLSVRLRGPGLDTQADQVMDLMLDLDQVLANALEVEALETSTLLVPKGPQIRDSLRWDRAGLDEWWAGDRLYMVAEADCSEWSLSCADPGAPRLGVELAYRGPISADVVNAVIDVVDDRLEALEGYVGFVGLGEVWVSHSRPWFRGGLEFFGYGPLTILQPECPISDTSKQVEIEQLRDGRHRLRAASEYVLDPNATKAIRRSAWWALALVSTPPLTHDGSCSPADDSICFEGRPRRDVYVRYDEVGSWMQRIDETDDIDLTTSMPATNHRVAATLPSEGPHSSDESLSAHVEALVEAWERLLPGLEPNADSASTVTTRLTYPAPTSIVLFIDGASARAVGSLLIVLRDLCRLTRLPRDRYGEITWHSAALN